MSEPKRFWRFSYDSEESVAHMIVSGTILAPMIGIRSDKYDPDRDLAKRIRIGDGVFLGRLDPDMGIGRVVAIGIVNDERPVTSVTWKSVSVDLHPNSQGGIPAWRERCFKFDGKIAEGYDLAQRFRKHFP